MTSPLLQHLRQQAARRQQQGLRRTLGERGPADLVDLAGNDYLALLHHPLVLAGAQEEVAAHGGGAGASRLVSGTVEVHSRLERELADLCGAEQALVLSSGYQANLAAVTALADAGTTIISDAHVHASLVDAARLARGSVVVSRHNDLDDVERLLRAVETPRCLLLAESIYSVLGDAAPLPELAALAERHGATLLVDEAHGLGMAGPGGAGLVAAHGLWQRHRDHLVVTMTLSKSLAAQGGVVLGPDEVVDHLVNTARPFIYDTGLAPAAAGAALGAMQALRQEDWRLGAVRQAMARLAAGLGLEVPAGAVLSVRVPGPQQAVEAVAAAREQSVRIGCFRPPSSPDGQSRLRMTCHAELTDAQLDHAVGVVAGFIGR
ncbi:aminotransferase class I/II-fold pyridoxal phosphate-dependent enzyme [Luteococcus peritonei]|uniref:8-amino-7-oxononanoate synthase n=1 Tax=Luteococcus peritonei TaxID=88874 RepID=A0ABW4RVZ1_9ACTN